jgi:iron complex transport system ATP-binding protein
VSPRPIARLEGAALAYPGGRPVFPALDLSIEAGSFTVLVGPNGSGKSTLLYAVGGLLRPRSGKVLMGGEDLYRMPRADRSRLVSAVFTDALKPEWMRARDIVALGRHPHTGIFGRLSKPDWDIVDDALGAAGAAPLADRLFARLSDGERQKVLVARALAQDCPLILLDEPTVFLDAPSKRDSLELLRNLARHKGKTIVAALHELELALEFADRLLVASGSAGTVSSGVPEALALSGEISRAFGKQPQAALGDTVTDPLRLLFGASAPRAPRGPVLLSGGNGAQRYWTQALLARLGFSLGAAGDPELGLGQDPSGGPVWAWAGETFRNLDDLAARLASGMPK